MGLKLSQAFRSLLIEISSATFPFLDLNSTSLSHFPYTVSWKEEISQCLYSCCQMFSDLAERWPFSSEFPDLLKTIFRTNSTRWDFFHLLRKLGECFSKYLPWKLFLHFLLFLLAQVELKWSLSWDSVHSEVHPSLDTAWLSSHPECWILAHVCPKKPKHQYKITLKPPSEEYVTNKLLGYS